MNLLASELDAHSVELAPCCTHGTQLRQTKKTNNTRIAVGQSAAEGALPCHENISLDQRTQIILETTFCKLGNDKK